MADQQLHQSIARAATILDVVASSSAASMRASEIAEAAGFGISTTTRLLATLQELGYVGKITERDYVLGTKLLQLATQELNHDPVFREGRMMCQSLAQSTRLSANLGIRQGASCVYLCHFEGDLSPKNQSMTGASIPLHASGLGKCLLLDTTPEERVELLGPDLTVYTAHTISTHAALTDELQEVTARGFAVEDQEFALGRFCLATPIRDHSGSVCAAVSVSGRRSMLKTLDRDDLTEQLIEVADRISVNLGHLGGASPA